MMDGIRAAPEAGEVVAILTRRLKPGTGEEIRRTIPPSIHLARAEPGDSDFRFFQVNGEADRFVVCERSKDRAAPEPHRRQPCHEDALQLFQDVSVKPPSEADDVRLTDLTSSEGKRPRATVLSGAEPITRSARRTAFPAADPNPGTGDDRADRDPASDAIPPSSAARSGPGRRSLPMRR